MQTQTNNLTVIDDEADEELDTQRKNGLDEEYEVITAPPSPTKKAKKKGKKKKKKPKRG